MPISRFTLQSGGRNELFYCFKKHDFSQIIIRRGPTCCHYILQEQAVQLTTV